jgi:hypothetical protein
MLGLALSVNLLNVAPALQLSSPRGPVDACGGEDRSSCVSDSLCTWCRFTLYEGVAVCWAKAYISDLESLDVGARCSLGDFRHFQGGHLRSDVTTTTTTVTTEGVVTTTSTTSASISDADRVMSPTISRPHQKHFASSLEETNSCDIHIGDEAGCMNDPICTWCTAFQQWPPVVKSTCILLSDAPPWGPAPTYPCQKKPGVCAAIADRAACASNDQCTWCKGHGMDGCLDKSVAQTYPDCAL